MALIAADQLATRYTVDEYEALANDPDWEGRRVELIHGVIMVMGPLSEDHEAAVDHLHYWLIDNVDREQFVVRRSSAIRTSDSEPQPDVMVVPRAGRGGGALPRESALVVEVAVASKRHDTVVKPDIYAEGVAEYWVVDLPAQTVIVHREPGPDGYTEITTHTVPETLAPVAAPVTTPLALAELFGTSHA
ncbi:MAG: Uma2 family endonuclease [Solirubrobacterales bacterium]|nr:Uma2 family endonuclease [Solirubrobacterales bacterium]